ncbi:hypothetical protein [Francisella salimarina]|uniref:hypothetical protein n=1 Tax=Francisella salimarina TaxID=2599927 RepID=UPI003D81B80C
MRIKAMYIHFFFLLYLLTAIAGIFSWYKYNKLEQRTAKDYRYQKEDEYGRLAELLKSCLEDCYAQTYYGNTFREGNIAPSWSCCFNGKFFSTLQKIEKLLEIYMDSNDERFKKIIDLRAILNRRDEIISDNLHDEFSRMWDLIRGL